MTYVDNHFWTVISVLGLASYIFVLKRLCAKSKQTCGTEIVDNDVNKSEDAVEAASLYSNGQPDSGIMRKKKVGKVHNNIETEKETVAVG